MLDMITEPQEKSEKIRTIFLLDRDKREELEKRSADTGAPISELLRRAVTRYLSGQEQRA